MTPETPAPAAGPAHRVLGALIMTKAALPTAVLALLAFGVWQIASGVWEAVDTARAAIEKPLQQAREHVAAIRAEGDRLLGEVKKIENATAEVAGSIKESVEPIRKSLLGLSSALKTVSSAVGSILNAVIRVVNGMPFVRDIPYVRLPDISIPGLTLPKLNIDVNLKPDLEVVRQLNDAAQEIATQAQQGIDRVTGAVLLWWWSIKTVAALVLLWVMLSVVGYAARTWHRLATGWQMVRGRRVEGALALL